MLPCLTCQLWRDTTSTPAPARLCISLPRLPARSNTCWFWQPAVRLNTVSGDHCLSSEHQLSKEEQLCSALNISFHPKAPALGKNPHNPHSPKLRCLVSSVGLIQSLLKIRISIDSSGTTSASYRSKIHSFLTARPHPTLPF